MRKNHANGIIKTFVHCHDFLFMQTSSLEFTSTDVSFILDDRVKKVKTDALKYNAL